MRRVSIVAKEGIPCLVRVLGSVEDLDTSAADALSSTLSALLPSCDSLDGRARRSPECIDLCIWLMVVPFCSMGCACCQ